MNIDLRVIGITGSSKMLLSDTYVIESWKEGVSLILLKNKKFCMSFKQQWIFIYLFVFL